MCSKRNPNTIGHFNDERMINQYRSGEKRPPDRPKALSTTTFAQTPAETPKQFKSPPKRPQTSRNRLRDPRPKAKQPHPRQLHQRKKALKPHSRVRRLKKDPLTAIPCRMHRISSDLRSGAAQGTVSTRVGERLCCFSSYNST